MKLFELLEAYTEKAGNWSIKFNEHKDDYHDINKLLSNMDDVYEFESDEAKKKVIDSDSLYVLHWYNLTPVGSYTVCASSLEEIEPILEKLKRRFTEDRYTVSETGCWEWNTLDSSSGYGNALELKKRYVLPHKLSYYILLRISTIEEFLSFYNDNYKFFYYH